VDDARHTIEVTRRMHALAASPEGQTLTLSELERAAEHELAAVLRSTHAAGEDADGVAGALRGSLRR
jgi:hypothetical protein